MNSTLAPIGFALPRLIRCEVCKGSGQGRATLCCDVCDGMGGWQSVDWPLATLAHNLAIAAFGQRMFELSSEYRMRAMLGLPASEDWTPGCGKQAE